VPSNVAPPQHSRDAAPARACAVAGAAFRMSCVCKVTYHWITVCSGRHHASHCCKRCQRQHNAQAACTRMRVASRLWCASRHVVSVISTPLCSLMACRASVRQQCHAHGRIWHGSRSCRQVRSVHGSLERTLPASPHLCKPSWALLLQHTPPAGGRRRVWHSQPPRHDVAGRRPHRARVVWSIDHLRVEG
jgi:hypothetical protein